MVLNRNYDLESLGDLLKYLYLDLGLPWWLSGKESACLQCRRPGVQSLGQEDPLEKEMATRSSILAWEIPWTEEPGRLPSMGLQRVGHSKATSLHLDLCGCLIAKSSPALWDPMDGSPPGSSVHGIPQARPGVGSHFLLQWIFPTQESNLCLLNQQVDSLPLSHPRSPGAWTLPSEN